MVRRICRLSEASGNVVVEPGRCRQVAGCTSISMEAAAAFTCAHASRNSESVKHPARMLPAIAAHAVEHYTQPGDLVLDPMCGIGTTLVEAVHAGRDAIGVEYESTWSDIADANIKHAHTQGATAGTPMHLIAHEDVLVFANGQPQINDGEVIA
jgi:modification methylase